MKEVRIKLDSIDSAKKFVLASSQCDSDVNVRKEMYQYYVDGKSIDIYSLLIVLL